MSEGRSALPSVCPSVRPSRCSAALLPARPVSRPAVSMEAVVRRCPFLARVSQAFLQKAGPSLLFYAQHCPRMMEAAPSAAARGLATSAARGQQAEEETPAVRRGEYGRSELGPLRRVGGGSPGPVTGAVAGSWPRTDLVTLTKKNTSYMVERSFWSGQLRGEGCRVL